MIPHQREEFIETYEEPPTRRFSPIPGFDPCDGYDPRVRLSPDNPCAPGEDLPFLAEHLS